VFENFVSASPNPGGALRAKFSVMLFDAIRITFKATKTGTSSLSAFSHFQKSEQEDAKNGSSWFFSSPKKPS
jgi:hypothetical protein